MKKFSTVLAMAGFAAAISADAFAASPDVYVVNFKRLSLTPRQPPNGKKARMKPLTAISFLSLTNGLVFLALPRLSTPIVSVLLDV